MANLQRLDFPGLWRGLYARVSDLPGDQLYAAIATNCEFLGGALGKRGGSQLVNGFGAYALGNWVGNNGSGKAAGGVNDPTGFIVGDTVIIVNFATGAVYGGSGGLPDGSLQITGILGTTITLNTTLPASIALPQYSSIQTLRGYGLGKIGGLFQANQRDGTQVLLATALDNTGLQTVNLVGTGQLTTVLSAFPTTTTHPAWGSAATGQLTSVEGLEIGDPINIGGYDTVVTGILVNLIGVNPPLPAPPGDLTPVTFFPKFSTGLGLSVFAQFANVTTIVQDGYPPMKYWYSARTTAAAGWTTGGGLLVDSTGFIAGTQQVVIFDSTTGAVWVRLATVAGSTMTLGTTTPTAAGAGSVVQRIRLMRHGIKPPATAITAGVGAAGSPNGVYSYMVKFRNSLTSQESEPGPESAPVTLTNQQGALTGIPVSLDPQVDMKRLYRTVAGGGGLWYFLAEITNSTTTYTDNTADTGLGDLMREFLDNTSPATVTAVVPWPQANALIAIDAGDALTPARVIWSDVPDVKAGTLKGESWPVDNFLFIGLDTGDPPIGLAPFFDSVLVFCQRSVWRIQGTPPDLVVEPVNFRADNTGLGAFGHRSLVIDQDQVIFPALDGFYSIARYQGVQQGFTSTRISHEIDALYATINQAAAKRFHAVYFRPRKQLRCFVSIPSTTTDPRDALVYQFDGTGEGDPAGWSRWNLGNTDYYLNSAADLAITASCVARGNPDVMYVATATGKVLMLDVLDTNSSGPGCVDFGGVYYPTQYRTVWVAPGGMGRPTLMRFWDLVSKRYASTPTLTLNSQVDFQDPAVLALTTAWTPVPAVAFGDAFDRIVYLARGIHHYWEVLDTKATGMDQAWTIPAWAVWFQALPVAAVAETVVQSNPVY